MIRVHYEMSIADTNTVVLSGMAFTVEHTDATARDAFEADLETLCESIFTLLGTGSGVQVNKVTEDVGYGFIFVE